ncbi:MAG: DUF4910 domain-containing protein [Pseudomonadota bacterium]
MNESSSPPAAGYRAAAAAGTQMFDLVEELYPICRSITGDGVRETLRRVSERLPLTVHEVPSGTAAFDWTIPDEWNVRDGYVADLAGNRVIDFQAHNLHVLNYSEPVDRVVTREELFEHLFTLPDRPDWIPYRTSYYNRNWGFCASANQAAELTDDEYRVVVDADLEPGSLTYGEYLKRGRSEEEVLISCHVCHPSLVNDNLSGIALATELARTLEGLDTHYSYRFLFVPGTIGSIAWLSRNEAQTAKIHCGLVVVCVGDAGAFSYKKSRRGDTVIDRAVLNVLTTTAPDHKVIEFYPYGYDERQYCSPGFDLAVGSLSRTTHGEYPEYHTSADDLSFVSAEQLAGSLDTYLQVIEVLECDRRYLNLSPKCEPQLGKRGLYGAVGALDQQPIDVMTILWVLNLSDGEHSLLDISERSGIAFRDLQRAVGALLASDLLAPADSAVTDVARIGGGSGQ